jgi:hypothetical protein
MPQSRTSERVCLTLVPPMQSSDFRIRKDHPKSHQTRRNWKEPRHWLKTTELLEVRLGHKRLGNLKHPSLLHHRKVVCITAWSLRPVIKISKCYFISYKHIIIES